VDLYIINTSPSLSDITLTYNEPFLRCYSIYWCVTSPVPVHRYTVLPKPSKPFQKYFSF